MSRGGRPGRRRWGWRRIHKWLAIAAGVVLTVWIVSGVLIAVPGGGAPRFQQLSPPVDLGAAVVSPAEAIAAASEGAGGSVRMQRGALIYLGSRPAYQLQVPGRGSVLVDARSAELIEIDAAEALRIVTEQYGDAGSPGEPELVQEYSLRYFIGTLPAYRITFDDEYGTEAYVSLRNGSVTWWDGRVRARRLMAAAHDWWPIASVAGPGIRLAALTVAGVLAMAATLTGYWLAVRRKRRRA